MKQKSKSVKENKNNDKKRLFGIAYVYSFQFAICSCTLVHQQMGREAYKLLKLYVGQDIYKMKDPIGYNEEGTGPFTPGGLVVIGAFQEDQEDITGEGDAFPNTTMTHFWNPNCTDDQGSFTWSGYEYSNALEKQKNLRW